MRSLLIGVAVALIVVLLYLTNPDTEAFANRYVDRINAEVAQELGLTGPLGQLLGEVGQSLIEDAIARQVRRDDYLLVSVFTLPASGDDLRIVGVAGRFYALDRR